MSPYWQHIGSKQSEPQHLPHRAASLGAGVLVSMGLHAVLVAVIIFGLPVFWEPEQLPGAIGIELAQLSDITAAPKVQKEGKPNNKPVQQVAAKVEQPKKETPPPPPEPPKAAAPPPPPPPEEEVAEPLPDPEAVKKEEQKKAEEEKKKKEEEKKKKEAEKKKKEEEKKRQQAEDAQFAQLLDVMNKEAAPEPEAKPEKKKEPEPPEPSTGEMTETASPVRLTAAQEEGFKRQLIPNWNYDAGIANPENYVVTVRIDLAPDGTVLRAEILDRARMGDPVFRSVAETARRAPLKLGRFELAPGEPAPPQVDIVFDLARAINGSF